MGPLRILLGLLLAACPLLARAEPLALVGILQGQAVLVRQASRFTLAEGAALVEGDIVETAPGAFAQIEFADGVLLGVGESARLLLKPRLTGLKTLAAPRAYVLEGWFKVRLPAKPAGSFDVLAAQFELDVRSGSAVAQVQPRGYAVFVESGAAQLLARGGARTPLGLKGGDFAAQPAGGDEPAVSARVAPEFVQQLPRPFRDPLPARGARYANQAVALAPLGPIAYGDVAAWMRSESGVRLALSRQWRGRAADRAFRAEVDANLKQHMEWERVIHPERFLPKKPPEARPASPPATGEGAITTTN